jgi:hypothetical protein
MVLNPRMMQTAASLLFVLLIANVASAQQDTTGKQMQHAPGFTFGSNVYGTWGSATSGCIRVAVLLLLHLLKEQALTLCTG